MRDRPQRDEAYWEWRGSLEPTHRPYDPTRESHSNYLRRTSKAHRVKRDPATGELVFFNMCPARVCFDQSAGFKSGRWDDKARYICAICGNTFGYSATVKYYLALGAWAHSTCIARHCCGEQDACVQPPHERGDT